MSDYGLVRAGTRLELRLRRPSPEDYGFGDAEDAARAIERASSMEREMRSSGPKLVWAKVLIPVWLLITILSWNNTEMPLAMSLVTLLAMLFFIGPFVQRAAESSWRRELPRRLESLEARPDYVAAKRYESDCRSYDQRRASAIEHYEQAMGAYRHRVEQGQRAYWLRLRGTELEHAAASVFRDLGYDATVTKAVGDAGIDISLVKDGKTSIVQCKGFDSPAGPAIVRDLFGTLVHSGAEKAYLVCPVGFTSGVKTFAQGKAIELVDAEWLVRSSQGG